MASPPSSTRNAEPEKKKLLSCYQCRSRKLKCNRVWPCSRCLASGAECEFPTGRMKPKEPVKRPRFKQLESRLHVLEHRFKDDNDSVQGQRDYPTPESSSSKLLHTGRFEQHPPQEIVDELTNLYFLHLYSNAPMQHPGRYFASLVKPPHLQPPLCLQYIILALGATVSPQHKGLALPFYHRAKRYMDHDDMTDDGYLGMTVAHAQCWELFSHFEAKQVWFTRAPTSISRSVRLSQMLGLDSIDDGSGASRSVLPPARDWIELEERRRTMWSIFCSDLDTSSTTGWPMLLKADKIRTLLPASDESFMEGFTENSVSLSRALRDPNAQYSTYACRILGTLLYHECTNHTMQTYSVASEQQNLDDPEQQFDLPNSEDFARTHLHLDDRLALMFMALPSSLTNPSRLDGRPEAAPIVLKLHTSVIAIHRKLTARLRSTLDDNSPSPSSDQEAVLGQLAASSARMIVSADEIYSLVVSTTRDPIVDFSNIFVTFGAFMASFAYLEDFVVTQNKASEEKLGVLMDLLIAGAEENSMAASLAVQLGHEAHKNGMDRSALVKVMHIIKKMQPDYIDRLMGQQDTQSGGTVFCPLAKLFPGAS